MSERESKHGVADQQAYFDAVDAYVRRVWGQEIHVGLFESPDDDLGTAMRRTNDRISEGLGLAPGHELLEVGCGYGNTARFLAGRYGCRVVATNISERELEHGRELAREAGVDDRVAFEWADFQDLPYDSERFDVYWCQDSLLYAADKRRVVAEAHRVLKPGGRMVFTELLLRRDTPDDERARLCDGIGTPGLWDAPDYAEAIEAAGFAIERLDDWSGNVLPTFEAVMAGLIAHRPVLQESIPPEFLAKSFRRIATWVEAAVGGRAGWIYVVARK